MKSKSVLGLALTAIIIATSAWVVTHQQEIIDWWRLRDYSPSSQIEQLVADSGMNEEGERLFYVHYPELLDKSEFNGKCDIGEETIILGCYLSHDKIYVFNVNNPKLNGIEEVTSAHEMLHAAYDRLDTEEKQHIDNLLTTFYESLNDERLTKTVENYKARDASVVPNELHSILGTEVRDLSDELEEYYSRYFEDRLEVVELAEAYEAEFTTLEQQIADYDSQLKSLGSDIQQLESDLELLSSALQSEQQQLESMRSNPQEYNEAVPAYNQKVREYNAQLNQLREMINRYNQLVEERNSIALEEQDLIQSIDSNYTEL